MNLKDFLTNREHPPELYWSLIIEPGWIQAGIWYIGENTAEVVAIGPPTAWEGESELVGSADAALSSAVQKLPENYKEPDKTVFGVTAAWVKNGEIDEEHLQLIKRLCGELSLSPVGFVVLPEAIAHLYKSVEGTPLNAIIVGLGTEELEVSVFKLGTLAGTTQVSRSVSLIDDVVEGLSRFEGAAPLPSRFIVYDGKEGELEEAKEALMQASWIDGGKIKFLHTPKAEVLDIEKKALAVSLAGASEIGDVKQVSAVNTEVDMKEEVSKEEIAPVTDVKPEEFGFAVGEDVSSGNPPIENVVPVQETQVKPSRKFRPLAVAAGYALKAKTAFHSFSNKFTGKFATTGRQAGKRWPVFLGIGISLLVLGFLYWWFVPKAKILIYATPKKFEQVTQVTFSTSGQSDPANQVVPAQVISDQVQGEKTKATSGIKLVGNKAIGSVQIANGNTNPVSLSAGTFLVSSGSLKFVTNASASVSGQLLPGSPGMASVDITAYDIGSQYNLAKGEVFSVGNYSRSLVAATSTGDFTGGSSQEISAVSKDDQANLENELKSELIQKATNDISAKVSSSQIFVNTLADVSVAHETFDHKIGDSSDSLKLSLTLDATGLAADKTKLFQVAANVLRDKVPEGYILKSDQLDFKFELVSKKDGVYVYNATIGANFTPQVDSKKLILQIKGKTITVTENYLGSIPGFVRAAVTFKPHLPSFLQTIPRIEKNISIEILPEE